MDKYPRIFILCFPHLGMLDSWLPIIYRANNLASHLNFTLIIPSVMIVRNFHRDNAIVKISDSIFDEVLIHAYDEVWIKHNSVFSSIKWYQHNRIILRLSEILKRLINKRLFLKILIFPLILLRNKAYKNKCKLEHKEFSKSVSQNDILFYDIATEGSPIISGFLQLFENNNKYSLSHAINMLSISQKITIPVNNKNNNIQEAYIYSKFETKYYALKYGLNTDKIHVSGIPRHDSDWIKVVQEESCELPDNFKNNTIVLLSRQVDGNLLFNEKVESLKNIKKLFIDKLSMRVIIKQHPSEKQERIFLSKQEKVYENIFGLNNYGITWIFSDLHVFASAQGSKLAISLYTGVVFDMVAMGIPCIEYIDSPIKLRNSEEGKEGLSQFVKYGFIKGLYNYPELCAYVDNYLDNPNHTSTLSIHSYKKYFPISNDVSRKIATEILYKNRIVT